MGGQDELKLTAAQARARDLLVELSPRYDEGWVEAGELHGPLVREGLVADARTAAPTGQVLSTLVKRGVAERRWSRFYSSWTYRPKAAS